MAQSKIVKSALAAIFSSVIGNKLAVIQHQWELAKRDMAVKAKRVGAGAGLLVAASTLMFFMTLVLLAAAVLGLATAMPAWLAALIVAGALFVLVLLFGTIGGVLIQRNKDIYPAEQVDKVKESLTSL